MPAVTSDTLIPIGAAAAIVIVVLVPLLLASLKLIRRLDAFETQMIAVVTRLDGEWTKKDQQIFQLQLQLDNPQMRVPGVKIGGPVGNGSSA